MARHRVASLALGCAAGLVVSCDSPPSSRPALPASTWAAATAAASASPTASTAAGTVGTAAPCVEKVTGGPPLEEPASEDLQPTVRDTELLLEQHHQRHPCITELVELGRTHLGRPIRAVAIGRRRGIAPAILLNGAHHGDEPLSAGFVLDAVRYLLSRAGRDKRVDRWLDELTIWAIPVVNPDGLDAFLTRRFHSAGVKKPGRKNARDNDRDGRHGPNDGVDLNRNYPFKWGFLGEEGSTKGWALHTYRGPAAGSEPETKAVVALADREVFAAAISYHVGAVAILVPYTIDRVRSPQPNEAWPVARDVARAMAPHPDVRGARGFPVRRNLYSVDGTDQDWHRARHGTLALLVEGALRGSAQASKRRPALVRANRTSWMALCDRLLDGPSITGRVIDAQGRPVVAEVHLEHQELGEGESWKSRCRDGSFSRFVDKPGSYSLVVRAGAVVTKLEVAVTGRVHVTVKLSSPIEPGPCTP